MLENLEIVTVLYYLPPCLSKAIVCKSPSNLLSFASRGCGNLSHADWCIWGIRRVLSPILHEYPVHLHTEESQATMKKDTFPWKGDGLNNPGNHFQREEGQEGDWEQSTWIYEGEIMLNQRDSIL